MRPAGAAVAVPAASGDGMETQTRTRTQPFIAVENLEMVFETFRGEAVHALSDIRFAIEAGEFVSVVGPSGCGKTTLLRVLAGLIPGTGGEVFLGGIPVTGPSKDVGIVFQKPVLLPWRSVLSTVMLPTEILKLPS